MTHLTCDKLTEFNLGDLVSIPVAARVEIFTGALVCTNGEGYAVPASDRPAQVFEGVCTTPADNRHGENGAMYVCVRRRGHYKLNYHGAFPLTEAARSVALYAVDDQTVDFHKGVNYHVLVGRLVRIDGLDRLWVAIDFATGLPKITSEQGSSKGLLGQLSEALRRVLEPLQDPTCLAETVYVADGHPVHSAEPMHWLGWRWKYNYLPSMFMPREAARLWVIVKAIRRERVQRISLAGCITEGIGTPQSDAEELHAGFWRLWDSLHKKPGTGWADDPWVWVYEIMRTEKYDASLR